MIPELEPVTVTTHEPEERVHEPEERETLPVPVRYQDTVPVGENPVTATAHIATEPTEMEEKVQLTSVEEAVLSDITVTVLEPELVTNTSPLPESSATPKG
jgi:hypothetical protein